jgi:hypothetical protein
MPTTARKALAIVASSLLLAPLASCDNAPEQQQAVNPLLPTQAELDSLKGDGLMRVARDASKLELFLHYKLMQANGLEQELGGEQQAVAALTAVSAAFERSITAAQTDVPRMIPAAFDGNGLAVGVMGVGYGLVGGFMVGALSGNMTEQQVADAVKRGPIESGSDTSGGARVEFSQGATDTAMTQTVNENGLTGTVKTRMHADACPDADGKLVVEIDSESQMSAGGKSGSVKVKLHYEVWLDDDANRTDDVAFDMTTDMSGSGSGSNTLDYGDHIGIARDGTRVSEITHQQGLDIFHPEDVKTTEKLRDATPRLLILVAEGMLAHKPWESGRCVDLKVRSDPAKRTGARPNTAYTLFAEPRSRLDGAPTGGTVLATLDGASTLNPTTKVKADARFDYANPDKKSQSASIAFEARSRRGIGRATLAFDTKDSHAYRIAGGQNDFHVDQVVCSLTEPFDLKSNVGIVMHMSGGEGGGSFTVSGRAAGVAWSGNGRYTLAMDGNGGKLSARGTTTISSPAGRFSDSVEPTFTLTPVDEGCGSG